MHRAVCMQKVMTLEVILNFADPKGTEKTLDIATGTGFTAFALAPKVSQVFATDLTPEMVAKASELAQEQAIENVAFSVAAAESLPFTTASLDLVTCRLAPHHFQMSQNSCARCIEFYEQMDFLSRRFRFP